VVEEFLASSLWPLGRCFGFSVETKKSSLYKVIMSVPQIATVIRSWSLVPNLRLILRKPLMSWLADSILRSIRLTRGFIMGNLITFFSWPDFFVSPVLSVPGVSAR
jgi:hypothetical protein